MGNGELAFFLLFLLDTGSRVVQACLKLAM